MPAAVASEIEALLPVIRPMGGRARGGGVVSIPISSRGEARPAYGPMTHRVVQVLERAAHLTHDDIWHLADVSARVRQDPEYAEALLAARTAAEEHGRKTSGNLAGSRAEWIVVQRAGDVGRSELDCARWTVMAEEAAWTAGDAARALVVGDLLSDAQLTTLVAGWSAVCGHPRP